jgi:hypothetical protein
VLWSHDMHKDSSHSLGDWLVLSQSLSISWEWFVSVGNTEHLSWYPPVLPPSH